MTWQKGGNSSKSGIFSRSVRSLEVQISGLLEGLGGARAATLLDGLAELTERERELVLPILIRAVNVIAQRPNRLTDARDETFKDFEEGLFGSLAEALNADPEPVRANEGAKPANPLALLDGGKTPLRHNVFRKPVRVSALLDLSKARENRVYPNSKGNGSKAS